MSITTLSPLAHEAQRQAAVPVSERIRQRLRQQQARYFANDNIAAAIGEGELDELLQEVGAKLQGVLESLVIDTEHDHNSIDTSRRVARMFINEVFGGRYRPMPAVTAFPNVARLNELMMVGPLTVRSACSHHLCPVIGQLWIGLVPNADSSLIGLSKYARLAQWVMARPQIQEEAVVQLADLLEKKIMPDGLAIVMKADHFCMQWRGVQDMEAKMVNSVMRGVFLHEPSLRQEFFALVQG